MAKTKFEKILIAGIITLAVLASVISIVVYGGIFYIVIHFVSKMW